MKTSSAGCASTDAHDIGTDVARARDSYLFQTQTGSMSRSGTAGERCTSSETARHGLSRAKGHSLNERFPELRDAAKSVKATRAILDGEIVALDENGMPCFDRLQFRKGRPCSIVFYAFDLLYLDGFNLTQCPLLFRKKALKKILT